MVPSISNDPRDEYASRTTTMGDRQLRGHGPSVPEGFGVGGSAVTHRGPNQGLDRSPARIPSATTSTIPTPISTSPMLKTFASGIAAGSA